MFGLKIDNINSFQMLDTNTLEPIAEFSGVKEVTIESEVEPSSLSKEKLSFNHEASFECESIDCSLFLDHANDGYYNKPVDIEYYMPIMIQSRWHKKYRINKKWLKRYGMKKDSVLVKAKASKITFDTERENKYEIECDMNIEDVQYEFRPDQLRKNLKIG
jgi:hypothetical protein